MFHDDGMTTADASLALGVSVRQVRRLVAAGELRAVGRLGGSLVIATSSVHQIAARGSVPGRPWAERTAWAALDLLERGSTVRLQGSATSRLRASLRHTSAEQFVRLARRRASSVRLRAVASMLTGIEDRVMPTGVSVIGRNPTIATQLGLAHVREDVVDGYIGAGELDAVIAAGFLVPDTDGNVTLRSTGVTLPAAAPLSVVAIDLADSLDPRLRAAGLGFLRDRLEAL